MPERINGGVALAAIGALALLVSLFLAWYEPKLTGWTAFEALDLVLAAICLAAVATAIAEATGGRLVPALHANALPILGAVALVIVVASLINQPPAAADRDPDTGAWVALIGAFLLAAGGLLTRARVSLVITARSPDRAGEGGASPAASRVRSAPEPRPPSAARTERIPAEEPFGEEPPRGSRGR